MIRAKSSEFASTSSNHFRTIFDLACAEYSFAHIFCALRARSTIPPTSDAGVPSTESNVDLVAGFVTSTRNDPEVDVDDRCASLAPRERMRLAFFTPISLASARARAALASSSPRMSSRGPRCTADEEASVARRVVDVVGRRRRPTAPRAPRNPRATTADMSSACERVLECGGGGE
jgi:hypothetical protein